MGEDLDMAAVEYRQAILTQFKWTVHLNIRRLCCMLSGFCKVSATSILTTR